MRPGRPQNGAGDYVRGTDQGGPAGHATGVACRISGGRVEGVCLRGHRRAGRAAARRRDPRPKGHSADANAAQEARRVPAKVSGPHGAAPALDRLRVAPAAARGAVHHGRDGGVIGDRPRGGAPGPLPAHHRPHRGDGGRLSLDREDRRQAGCGARDPHVRGMAAYGLAIGAEHRPDRLGRAADLAEDARSEAGRDRSSAAGRGSRPRGWGQNLDRPSEYRFFQETQPPTRRTRPEWRRRKGRKMVEMIEKAPRLAYRPRWRRSKICDRRSGGRGERSPSMAGFRSTRSVCLASWSRLMNGAG